MALIWSLKNIENHSELSVSNEEGYQLCPLTNAVVWGSAYFNLGEITATNIDEWVFRATVLQSIGRGLTSRALTRQEIIRHIGLTTNAVRRTRNDFLREVMLCLEREVEWKSAKGVATSAPGTRQSSTSEPKSPAGRRNRKTSRTEKAIMSL